MAFKRGGSVNVRQRLLNYSKLNLTGGVVDYLLVPDDVALALTYPHGQLPDGSFQPLLVDATGALITSGGGSGGTVAVSNFPATQPVSGTVGVSNFPASQTVTGTVSVGNFPATQQVSVAAGQQIQDLPSVAYQTQTTVALTANGSQPSQTLTSYRRLLFVVVVGTPTGTTPVLNLFYDFLEFNSGQWVQAMQVGAVNIAATTSFVDSIGPGCAKAMPLGAAGRLRWTVTGTTPSFPVSYSIVGTS